MENRESLPSQVPSIREQLNAASSVAVNLLGQIREATLCFPTPKDGKLPNPRLATRVANLLMALYQTTVDGEPIIKRVWIKHAAIADRVFRFDTSFYTSRHAWCFGISNRFIRRIAEISTVRDADDDTAVVDYEAFYASLSCETLLSSWERLVEYVERFKRRSDLSYLETGTAFAEISQEFARALHLPATEVAQDNQSWFLSNPVLDRRRNRHSERKLLAALEYIRSNGPVKGILIANHLDIEESSFRSNYAPLLLSRGVKNDHSGDGYYFPT